LFPFPIQESLFKLMQFFTALRRSNL